MKRTWNSLKLYQDGFSVVHVAAWDEESNSWYYVCDVNHEIPHKRDDDENDSLLPYPTCIRCMTRCSWPSSHSTS